MERSMKRNLTPFLIVLFAVLACALLLEYGRTSARAATTGNRPVHVSGQPLPGTLGYATILEGGQTDAALNIDFIVLANTGSSDYTVTVEDCTSKTPFILFNAYTIAATTTWTVPLGGTRFTGCMKWAASNAAVMGTLVGTR